MFCKNCGREIDQKTLKKLMENKGEPVVCSKCKQPLDNAEICGGFWGLIASAKEKEAEDLRAGGTTVMLDENGKPVQMSAPVQNRTAPAVSEADRDRAGMGFGSEAASQSSGEYRSSNRSGSSYRQKESGIQPRRSGARKNNTELWITRAIAILLGICLIISLVRGCGHDEKRSAPDNPAVTGSTSEKKNTTDSGTGQSEEKQEDNSDKGKTGNSEEGKTDNPDKDQNGTTDQGEEKPDNNENEAPAAGPGTSSEEETNIDAEMQKYDTAIRTIIIDKRGNNLESKVSYNNSNNSKAAVVDRTFNESGDYLPSTMYSPGINNDTVVEKYTYKDANLEFETKYYYKNGYLQEKEDNNNTITYKTEGNDTVIETSKKTMTVRKHDGTPVKYKKVKKTYRKNAINQEIIDNKLQTIEYYKTAEAKVPDFTMNYNIVEENPADEYISTYGSDNVSSYVESYSIDGSNETISIIGPDNDHDQKPDYEYDQIKYTYRYINSAGDFRLFRMEYLKDGKLATGPNKFSYLICEYDDQNPSRRTDTFYGTDDKPILITARDPFLSDAVIPAFYSEEFPYLVGLPDTNSGADQTGSGVETNSGADQTVDGSGTNSGDNQSVNDSNPNTGSEFSEEDPYNRVDSGE